MSQDDSPTTPTFNVHSVGDSPRHGASRSAKSPAWGDPKNRKEHDPMQVELEKEFYTASFVASLHLAQERTPAERICGESFFIFAMILVAGVQCMTVFGMSTFLVEKEKGFMSESKLATGLFVNGGTTIPLGYAEDLCGSFNALPLEDFAGRTSLQLPDGTKYSGSSEMPVFHTYKMPAGSWGFDSIGGHESYVDSLLRVLRDARLTSWRDTMEYRVEYGYLFVAMVAVLWFYVLYELRKIARFMFLYIHLCKQGLTEDFIETTEVDNENGKIQIKHLNTGACIAGVLCIIARATVSTMMLVWGTSLLAATGNKLNLVLNAIAIGIVFELDVVIAYAVIDHTTMSRIESIEPVKITGFRKRSNKWDIGFGLVLFMSVFFGAMLVREWQVRKHTQQLQSAAALCLFAGPTPQARPDLIAPVAGFCESLLSLSCAPSVTGSAGRGPCVVTNDNIFQSKSIAYPLEGELFEGMHDANGERRSMARWGSPKDQLVSSRAWLDDANLNAFRKACVQLYQPSADVDTRLVDESTGVTTFSAPFFCSRDNLFEAIFGRASENFDHWSSALNLQSPRIMAALDSCQASPAAIGGSSQVDEDEDVDAESEAPPKAPLAAVQKPDEDVDVALAAETPSKPHSAALQKPRVTNFLKHRVHHEVRHYKIDASVRQ